MNTGRRAYIEQMMACCIYPFTHIAKPSATDAPGVVIRPSRYSVKETIERIANFLVQHGATIYARINQEGEIVNREKFLYPLETLLFGSGVDLAPLLALNPLMALDLPLKVIVWQDSRRKTWIAYNDGTYVKKRYSIPCPTGSALHLYQLVDVALV